MKNVPRSERRAKRPGKRGGTYFERAARVEYFQPKPPPPDALPMGQPLPAELRAQIDALRGAQRSSAATPLAQLAAAELAALERRTTRTLDALDLPSETRSHLDALRSSARHTSIGALALADLERAAIEREREIDERARGPQSIAELVGSARPTRHAKKKRRAPRRPVETHVERARRAGRPPRAKTRSRLAFEAKCEQDAPGCRPRAFESWVYAIVEPIMADDSGRAAELALEACRRDKIPGVDRALRAALGFDEKRRRKLGAFRARAVLALWIVIARSARHTDRRGFWRKTEGYTCRQLRALFVSPITGEVPSRACFDAVSWGGGRETDDDCGYLVALKRAGCMAMQQPRTNDGPGYVADPRYVGRVRFYDKHGNPRRCAFVVFWIYGHAGPPE